MEQIITLKVDLEHPDDAKFSIDEAVKVYEADKLKWTEAEIEEARHLAMRIMSRLCLDGYSIDWFGVDGYIVVFIRAYDEVKSKKYDCAFYATDWNIWIAKCVCLCRATGRDVPEFIIKKAGECWQ